MRWKVNRVLTICGYRMMSSMQPGTTRVGTMDSIIVSIPFRPGIPVAMEHAMHRKGKREKLLMLTWMSGYLSQDGNTQRRWVKSRCVNGDFFV